MIVVADTSPINYLLLIDQINLLHLLFQKVIIPDVVRDEMLDPSAPVVLQQWIVNPPLAQILPADLLIIDERLGRRIASERGIPLIGTLGILDDAANQGLVQLSEAIAQLQQTIFRISRRIIQALLQNRG